MKRTAPEVKRRLLRTQLTELVTWLKTDDRPELFGSRDESEWLLRLTAVVAALVARHRVDGHGRCEWCQQPRHGWLRLLPRWTNRAPCRVLQAAELFTNSEVEVVWWQVLNQRGDDVTLDEVRAWLRPDEPDDEPADDTDEWPVEDDEDDYGRHVLVSDGPVRLRDDCAPEEPQVVRPYVPPAANPTERFPRLAVLRSDADTELPPKINER